jgi:rhodanese-related sulfurtransferase
MGLQEVRVEPSIDCYGLYVRLFDDEVLIIDCRDGRGDDPYAVRIPGALAMCFDELVESLHVLPDDELIVLVGCAPDGSDSRRASRLLRTRGRDAVCLQGGLPAWIAGGYPTEPCSAGHRRQADPGRKAVAFGERAGESPPA